MGYISPTLPSYTKVCYFCMTFFIDTVPSFIIIRIRLTPCEGVVIRLPERLIYSVRTILSEVMPVTVAFLDGTVFSFDKTDNIERFEIDGQ